MGNETIKPLLFVLVFLLACGPEIQVLRTGSPSQPLEAGCPLELRSELTQAEQTKYEQIGTIVVAGDAGERADSPRLLALLKPQACNLGAELLIGGTSHDAASKYGNAVASRHFYTAFKARSAPRAVKF